MSKLFIVVALVSAIGVACLLATNACANESAKKLKDDVIKNKKLPKNLMFASDLDLEHLYEQWNDEPSDEDDDKQPKKTSTKITDDMLKDPENLMLMSKKGKTVMAFVTVANNPTKDETDTLTQRWQVGLSNNHIKCERFLISDDRAIFVFQDGALAFEAKDFLLSQPELKEYSIDNKVWQGQGYPVEYPNKQRIEL